MEPPQVHPRGARSQPHLTKVHPNRPQSSGRLSFQATEDVPYIPASFDPTQDPMPDYSSATDVTLISWDDIPMETLSPTIGRKLVSGREAMLAHVYLEKGAIVPKHQHMNEQITYILKGTLRFWIGEDEGKVIDVHEGEVLHIPSNVWHKAQALEETLDVDIFSPPRQDWLDGTDAYLRK